jgi:tetratricopeptide (TPR) repeat protein
VGRLDASLGRLGLRGETLLLVTSDHGEGLGDHGETLHGFFVYQSTLAVPLLVRGPGVVAGTRIATTVGLVDVFPTVVDLLGVALPAGTALAGRSLAEELRGKGTAGERALYAESLVPLLHFGWSDLRVVREGRFKYIQAPRPELYDLRDDPGETRNLAESDPTRAQAFRAGLGRFFEAEKAAAAAQAGAPAVSTELLEKLGALGYVGGAGGATTKTPGADPKDRIQDFRIANDLMRQGLLRLHDRAYAESVARFRAVLARGIESFEVHFYLARALRGLGKENEAIRHFEEAARRAPALTDAWEGMAGSLAALGRRSEARRALEKALPLAPRNAALRAKLGELLRDMGEVEEAIRRQREAVELAPSDAAYRNSLGMTLGGNGRLAEAEEAFREATRLDERSHRYAYNLGLILERQGRTAEARPWFEKALALEPNFAPARQWLAEIPR